MAPRRVFIAIDVTEDARAVAFRHIEELRRKAKDVRVSWEKPEKLHLTLKYLGMTEEAVLPELAKSLANVASQTKRFAADLSAAGVFPNARQPRVLWFGITIGSEAMNELAMAIENVCSSFGFEREKRRFSPHLTIARIREPAKGRQLAEQHVELGFEPVRFSVNDLVIYESKLSPTGSTYTALYRYPFGS